MASEEYNRATKELALEIWRVLRENGSTLASPEIKTERPRCGFGFVRYEAGGWSVCYRHDSLAYQWRRLPPRIANWVMAELHPEW
jgi:hypothetical protein